MALTTQQINQSSQVKIVDQASSGFSGLSAEDFLKVLIEQLKNQDPTDPMNSDQLLQQVSSMRALQSNIELSDSLKSLTLAQQLTSSTSFLGKEVMARDSNNQDVSGTVDRVVVKSGKTLLGIGTTEFELSQVLSIQ